MKKFLKFFIILILFCGKEKTKREILGIPKSAKLVVVIGQSSHFDLSWVKTFDEYYEDEVRSVLRRSVDFLQNPKHKIFFAETSFIKKFLDDERERENAKEILKFIKDGRLEIVGGGWGTADAILTPSVVMERDFIETRNILRELGIEVKDCWFPDSFGLSKNLPDVLHKFCRSVGFSRIDGIKKTAAELSFGKEPLKIEDTVEGSSARKLIEEGTNIFWWKGEKGKVLAYWMPYLYGQGENAFCKGRIISATRKDNPCIYAEKEEFFQNMSIEIEKLKPFTKTKYTFISAGWDFSSPVQVMAERIDEWNKEIFPKTGTYLVIGTFKDFVDILLEDTDKSIKEFDFDLQPYWTGFYGSRPYLKYLIKTAITETISAETLYIISKEGQMISKEDQIEKKIVELWLKIASLSHHDTYPGTSYPETVQKYEIPLAKYVIEESEKIMNYIFGKICEKEKGLLILNPLWFEREDFIDFDKSIYDKEKLSSYGNIFKVKVPARSIKIFKAENEKRNYVSLGRPDIEVKDGKIFFNDLEIFFSLWKDDGGVWRIGSEMENCEFKKTNENGKESEIYEDETTGYIKSKFPIRDINIYVEILKRNGLIFSIETNKIPQEHTLLMEINFPKEERLLTETYSGVIEREKKIYEPQFNPFHTFFIFGDYVISSITPLGVAKDKRKIMIFIGRNVSFEKCDVLGPIKNMNDEGPYIAKFSIIKNDIKESNEKINSAYNFSYSFHFPFKKYFCGFGGETKIISIPQKNFSFPTIHKEISIF